MIKPMLAKVGTPRDLKRKGWIYEPKMDGTRALVFKNRGIRILNRRGNWIEKRYPELARACEFIKAKSAILDGEIVVLNQRGIPDFGLLQAREQLTKPLEIELRAREIPATLVIFDILRLDNRDLTKKPLFERKKILEKIVKQDDIISLCFYTKNGPSLFREIKKRRMEGVMAKDINSPYLSGKRSEYWLKIKFLKTLDCVIVGYRSAARALGSFCLGVYRNGKLVYVGRVGSGWNEDFIRYWLPKLEKLKQRRIPVINPPSNWERLGIQWLKPELVCEVEYLQLNRELRAPVFKRMRPDKPPKECVLE